MASPSEAKFRLRPKQTMATRPGFDTCTFRRITLLVEARRDKIEGCGMVSAAENLWFDVDRMWVAVLDGRTMSVPLAWIPRLLHASAVARLGLTPSPL